MSDAFNQSMRKCLNQCGVTSQQAIEEAVRTDGTSGKSYAVKAVITIEELGMNHEVTGTISGQD